ncbi:hypothetical protein BH10BDE1_BH10BDE1_09070 [soil metagenome]
MAKLPEFDSSPDHYVERYTRPRSAKIKRWLLVLGFFVLLFAFNNCGQPTMLSAESQANVGSPGPASVTLPPTTPAAENPATKFASIAGVYSNGSLQVVTADGTYWSYGGYGIIQMQTGKITEAKDGKFAGEITGGNGAHGAFSGVFVQGVSFAGAAYQATSKSPPNLGLALGTFWGNSQDGDTPYLTFDSKGGITGYSANFQCTFRGKVVAHPSGLNVLQISLTRSNCLGNGKSDTYVGIARAYGSLVHVVATTADFTKTFTYEGYYESNQSN